MQIEYKENNIPKEEDIIELYNSVGWGHTKSPQALFDAIKNSSYVITAWENKNLIGLGRAISDETITVYFPDLLIKPDWQRKGIGTKIMQMLLFKYGHLHNQVLIAEDEKAIKFYKRLNFKNEGFALSIIKPFPNNK